MAGPAHKTIESKTKNIKPHLMRLFLVLALAVVLATFYAFGLARFSFDKFYLRAPLDLLWCSVEFYPEGTFFDTRSSSYNHLCS